MMAAYLRVANQALIASVLHNSRLAIYRKAAIGAIEIKKKIFNFGVIGFVITLLILRVINLPKYPQYSFVRI
jgi:hypothetical protein